VDGYDARGLLYDLASVYSQMDTEKQARVYKRVMSSGALPVSRDTPSYAAVMSVLLGACNDCRKCILLCADVACIHNSGGAAGQLEYSSVRSLQSQPKEEDEDEQWDGRAEAKRAHADRMAQIRFVSLSE
jgi:Pyruvate/2-oxoacid:ferredoxin oxidoreductase delta subunit